VHIVVLRRKDMSAAAQSWSRKENAAEGTDELATNTRQRRTTTIAQEYQKQRKRRRQTKY
jgi:hypothetical protein